MSQANQEKTIRVLNAQAAGTSDLTSSAIDTAGWDGVKIYTAFGTITAGAVTSVKLQQSSDDGVADAYADLVGSSVPVADSRSNDVVVHDIYRPKERYIKAVIDRGTQNAVVDGVWAVLYTNRKQPTTDDSATVVARKVLISPSEGTA